MSNEREHPLKITPKFRELHSFVYDDVVPLGINTCPGPPECDRYEHLKFWVNSPIEWARKCAQVMLDKGQYTERGMEELV